MVSSLSPALPAHYWLAHCRVPSALLTPDLAHLRVAASVPSLSSLEDLVELHLEIRDGRLVSMLPATVSLPDSVATWQRRQGLVWPCFVDLHTHLDKGHIWPRQPNREGTFQAALTGIEVDQHPLWPATDLYPRMDFALRCSYAHGTQALRTHLDSYGLQAQTSFEVIRQLQREWAGRLTIEPVSLVAIDYFEPGAGADLADLVADYDGILGAVVYPNPNLDTYLDRIFTLAQERQLNLDLHTDENLDPTSTGLKQIAAAKLRHNFSGQVVCGHGCSLAMQPLAMVTATIAAIKAADLAVVSLPLCNLYLQDRRAGQQTPRFRGVTLVHELKAAGVPVALASDNCRDPFFAYGDHDMLEVFNQAVRIGHLDTPFDDWPRAVTQTPAQIMGLPQGNGLTLEQPADLILFKARTLNELLSRPQSDRVVIRQGQVIDSTLPDYAELDYLMAVAASM